jgi:hypothetical protein
MCVSAALARAMMSEADTRHCAEYMGAQVTPLHNSVLCNTNTIIAIGRYLQVRADYDEQYIVHAACSIVRSSSSSDKMLLERYCCMVAHRTVLHQCTGRPCSNMSCSMLIC